MPLDCFRDITEKEGDTAATTCAPLQTTILPAQPVCTATATDTLVSTTAVTETLFSTVTMESVLTKQHYITVTATYTIPEVSELLCTQLPPLNSSSAQDTNQASIPSPGAVAAIILCIVLVILIMACTVAWVVSLKRKKEKLQIEGSGRLHGHVFVQFPTGNVWHVPVVSPLEGAAHSGLKARSTVSFHLDGVNCNEVITTHNSAELYESPDFSAPQYEMVSMIDSVCFNILTYVEICMCDSLDEPLMSSATMWQ